jgi:hypothetical protein
MSGLFCPLKLTYIMKKLSPRVHGILDYFTVLLLLSSPSLFDMQTNGALFTYVLAIVHLILTLLTDFPPGVFKIIPLKLHGLIEIVVSIALIVVAVWFRSSGDNVSFYYYLIFAIILFIVWTTSEYKSVLREIDEKDLKP